MGWGHLKILFLRTMKPEKQNFTWKLSDMEQRQVDYIMGPRGSNGNEMHIIFLHGPRLLRWAMRPLGLLFFILIYQHILYSPMQVLDIQYANLRYVNTSDSALYQESS
jgi:hypothetical protein